METVSSLFKLVPQDYNDIARLLEVAVLNMPTVKWEGLTFQQVPDSATEQSWNNYVLYTH